MSLFLSRFGKIDYKYVWYKGVLTEILISLSILGDADATLGQKRESLGQEKNLIGHCYRVQRKQSLELALWASSNYSMMYKPKISFTPAPRKFVSYRISVI